jgi:hypothetical protein
VTAPRAPAIAALLLTVLGVARIVATWHEIAQTVDETPNIACGMQWLDKGRYDYGPFHPPLSRVAMAIGPYLYGARSQGLPDRWKEGNAVLNSARKPERALKLARAGILPFFLAATAIVFFWSRRLNGDWGAVASVFVFTNLPPVLAHSGIATTDMAVAAGVAAALYAFTRWLDEPTILRSVLLGLALAFAFLSKFSALLSVSLTVICILVLYCLAERPGPGALWSRPKLLAIAGAVAFLTIWAAYRFSWGHMSEPLVGDATSQGGLLGRIPAPVLRVVQSANVPAPQVLDGLWAVHEHNYVGHAAYLLGQFRMTGWWYFFPVALGVKAPLAFLVLCGIGIGSMLLRPPGWRFWVPVAGAAVILVMCMPAQLNIGSRYLLPMFPLLSVVSGFAVVRLCAGRAGRVAAAVLLAWLCVSSATAHPDYLAYFNEIASRHPENVLVDSDLDWGQDVKRLCRKVKELHIDRLYLAVQYSGDDSRLDLPPWDGLDPWKPVTGWVAVSFTRIKTYSWLVAQQNERSEPGFAWLERYRPVARVGKSILLYYIPAQANR